MSRPSPLLERAKEFERRWDPQMGGTDARAYRDMFGLIAGRLILLHAIAPADLVHYLEELIEIWRQLDLLQAAAPDTEGRS